MVVLIALIRFLSLSPIFVIVRNFDGTSSFSDLKEPRIHLFHSIRFRFFHRPSVFTFSKISSSGNSNPSKIAPFVLPFLAYALSFCFFRNFYLSPSGRYQNFCNFIYDLPSPLPPPSRHLYSYVSAKFLPFPIQSDERKYHCTLLFHLSFLSRLFSFGILPILLRFPFLASCGLRRSSCSGNTLAAYAIPVERSCFSLVDLRKSPSVARRTSCL